MGNLDRARIPSDLAPLFEFMVDVKRRLRELERPVTLPDFNGETNAAVDALAAHVEEDIALVMSTIANEVVARQLADDQEVVDRNAAIEAARSRSTGLTLQSPDGTYWILGVSDAGSTTWTVRP